jgi:hypothetical protein
MVTLHNMQHWATITNTSSTLVSQCKLIVIKRSWVIQGQAQHCACANITQIHSPRVSTTHNVVATLFPGYYITNFTLMR